MHEFLALLFLVFLAVLAIKMSIKSLGFMYQFAFTIALILIVTAIVLI